MLKLAWLILSAIGLAGLASPASATQGFACGTKGISIDLLYGHAAVPGLLQATLSINDTVVPTAIAREWADDMVTMVDLADPDQTEVLSSLRLKWTKNGWRGTLTYLTSKYHVTCEELG